MDYVIIYYDTISNMLHIGSIIINMYATIFKLNV